MKLIDFHAHVFPADIAAKAVANLEEYYGCRWHGTGELDDLRRGADEAGISATVIFSCATKPEQVININNFISKLVDADPTRLIGFGTLHPDFGDFHSELRRISELGLRGLKFHPDFQNFAIDDPRMMRIYEAVGNDLVMLFHVGDEHSDLSSPKRLATVLDAFPGARIVAAHLGGYMRWDEAEKYLIGRDLWLDSSSSLHRLPAETARRLIISHGVERVLFASDYPAARPAEAIEQLRSLKLPEDAMERICHLNAEKLLGVEI